MNEKRHDAVEERLREYGKALKEQPMPESARSSWRNAIRGSELEGPRRTATTGSTSRSSFSKFAFRLRYVAAGLVAALVLVYLSPTVSLYAGSLPMVGPFFRMIGADRGLQLAADQGVARDLNLSETVNGVTYELLNVVADTSRTVLGFRITAPEGVIEQGDMINLDIYDQWGTRLPGYGSYYQTTHEDGNIVFTGYITSDGMKRLTRHLTLNVTSIGSVEGPWKFQFPVSYKRATSLVKKYDINEVSSEKAGVRLEVESVELHATETIVTYVFHGLNDDEGVHADGYRRPPQLFTQSGERLTTIRSEGSVRADRADHALVVRTAYEPLPEGVSKLRVVHEAVARRYTDGPMGRVLKGSPPSFTYRVTDGSSGRQVQLVDQNATQLWGTTVESTSARLEGNTLTLNIRGTDGRLVELVGFALRDDKDRSYSLGEGGFEADSETKFGHVAESGVHFEYTLTYELEPAARQLTLSFPEVLQLVDGPWEVEFAVPR